MATDRKQHEQWLKEITAIPTAAGREQRVVEWIRQWMRQRRELMWREDKAGNLIITQRRRARSSNGGVISRTKSATRPVFITAHLDHPAFVVRQLNSDGTIELEFRGGVSDSYFNNATIEIFDSRDRAHRARIIAIDPAAAPFKRVSARPDTEKWGRELISGIHTGDVARWVFAPSKNGDGSQFRPHVKDGLLYTHACDDLAAVAAALSTLDLLRKRRDASHVGLLFTRAEEIGFIGAIAACKHRSVPTNSRLICLENSRSFAESPIGAGPIVRVGDKMSVFGPSLTNCISMIMIEHQRAHPDFKWQRKLMPGGTCEATTFSTYGYQSTCLCLPLGNYHNMTDIDGVAAGKRPAKVGPEFISIEDYHGLIEMLIICATQLDSASVPSLHDRMEQLYAAHSDVLKSPVRPPSRSHRRQTANQRK
jgi:putative aminopeptidase FrvX